MADRQFLVVGIGASAGGVEALQAFFEPMPADPGMAFIVVTHLGEGYESALPQILERSSRLPVIPVRNGAAIEPNRVYVLSSDALPTVRRGKLRLRPQPKAGREHNPIDVLLASLAEDQGENSVAVILSGTGHDGTLGAKAIKEKGGLTIAQLADHTAPRYPDMPASAIASGAIDLKLAVRDMAEKLIEYARSLGTLDTKVNGNDRAERNRVEAARRQICDILRDELGHNFAGYKERSFLRRVERRMQVLETRDIDSYVERLRQDQQEMVQLFRDLLIGVTAFFRDTEAFDALAEQVIPDLFVGKTAADTVRVWVPGCATGEEAYSLAILLLEQMAKTRSRPKMVVFATDIDDPAIAVARAARYPAAMLQDVSPERLDRYFSGDGVSYTVSKEVRDLCIFSSHSVIRDPPFSRIDLISCRNLLIYLDKDLQDQLIPVFHYALRPSAYLFLGTSETLTQHAELFNPADNKHRIFRRRDHVGVHPTLPLAVPPGRARLEPKVQIRNHGALPLRHIVESRVIEQFAPAHVVVTRDGDIVHFSTRTGKYLESAPGAPTRNVAAMARRGIRLDLRTALAEAVEGRRLVLRSGLRLELDGRVQFVDLSIEPLPDHDLEPLFLIVFADAGNPLPPDQLLPTVSAEHATSTEQVETELRDTRERLQSTVEEYESALEELKSANEELVSINEELQSTNEELETSREEAQSVNEELHTVNSELERKVDELDRANDNLRNLFEGTEIATVFLDRHLVIRSFTPATKNIFNLMEIDRGRPLTDIVSEIVDLDLRQEIEPVLTSGQSRERRVVRRDRKAHYLMRVLPYQTADKGLDGVLVTFTDITRITEIEHYQEELNRRLETLLETVCAITERSLDGDAGRTKLLNRLQALAETYRLVAQGKWGDVALYDLATKELANYGIGRDGRVSVEGPPVLLRARAAVGLGMALHELAAIAAGDGALSVPQGRVHLSWAIEQFDGTAGHLVIRWRESGGPKVSEPEARGYGSALTENGLIEQIGASGSVSIAEDGIVSELILPLPSGLVQPAGAEGN